MNTGDGARRPSNLKGLQRNTKQRRYWMMLTLQTVSCLHECRVNYSFLCVKTFGEYFLKRTTFSWRQSCLSSTVQIWVRFDINVSYCFCPCFYLLIGVCKRGTRVTTFYSLPLCDCYLMDISPSLCSQFSRLIPPSTASSLQTSF